ncbi:MAG: ATP-binding protein [Thermoanaerobaculia bacterium]|nr:ATP-binding protein [Thermoanaerobaculia bacterium]
MDLREQIYRHRKDRRVIFAGLAALLLVCGTVYYLLLRGRNGEGMSSDLAASKLLLFVLWYINVILILAILFVLVRNIFNLVLERQSRILGSKFKTKLVVASVLLSLLPVMIIFPMAAQILFESFEQWFALPIEDVVEQADETVGYLTEEIQRNNSRAARRVLEEISDLDIVDLEQRAELQRTIQQLREEMEVHYLAIFDGTDHIHGTVDPSEGLGREPDFRGLSGLLQEAMDEGVAVRIVDESLGIEGRLLVAAAAQRRPPVDPAPEDGETGPREPGSTVILAGTVLPPDIAAKTDELRAAYQAYLRTSVQQENLRDVYLQNLLMVTLLVIFAFSSIGLRLARRVTVPIQALADGTRRISQGDLDHRVEVAVDDELRILVDGFNNMTEELKRSRELVDRQYRELRSSNKRLQAVLQNVAAGVIAIRSDERILTCNGAALDILAQREEDVLGRQVTEVWAEGERAKLKDLLHEEFSWGGQIQRQMQMVIGGVWKTLEVKVTTLPDPEGRPGGRVMVLEDLTELIQAQKMATWNEVARRIAHEIKNPLTPIQLTAERLLRRHQVNDPRLGETLEQGVEVIVREVDSLKTMVDEFSRFARMPPPRPKDVDVTKLFNELVHLHRDLKPGVDVHAVVAEEAYTVRFDPEQLKSVLINLIDNAMEATDAPGQIVLSSGRAGDRILLSVADTGRGITAEDRERIFLPYFSTKGRGSGLGLSIVHRIVNDHHASLQVKDNQPGGTVFTLAVPTQ